MTPWCESFANFLFFVGVAWRESASQSLSTLIGSSGSRFTAGALDGDWISSALNKRRLVPSGALLAVTMSTGRISVIVLWNCLALSRHSSLKSLSGHSPSMHRCTWLSNLARVSTIMRIALFVGGSGSVASSSSTSRSLDRILSLSGFKLEGQ